MSADPEKSRPFRFGPQEHLRRPVDFKRVYDRRRSASNEIIIVYAAPNELPHNRLGLSMLRQIRRGRSAESHASAIPRGVPPNARSDSGRAGPRADPTDENRSAAGRTFGHTAKTRWPSRSTARSRCGGAAVTAWLRQLLAGGIIFGVRCYQRCLRPVLPAMCRFQPSCSEYMILAVTKHGPIRGAWRRIPPNLPLPSVERGRLRSAVNRAKN